MNRARRHDARLARAAPSPEAAPTPRGCAHALAIYLGVLAVAYCAAAHWFWAVAAAPAVLIVALWVQHVLRERALLHEVRRAWEPRGIRCLVVYSDSPLWEQHVQERWLPRLRQIAEILNWSDRARWERSLPVRVFDHFCGRNRNFNPSVVVFRLGARPLVFRFFYAFREAKHGDGQFVALLEQQMFSALQLQEPQASVSGR